MVSVDTVCVLQTEEADAPGQAHTPWPGRRTVAACFGGFAIYAGLVAVFTVQSQAYFRQTS